MVFGFRLGELCRTSGLWLVAACIGAASGVGFAKDSTASQPSDPPKPLPAPAIQNRRLFWPKDTVALTQEVDAFTSLEDGQPGGPGDWELQLDSGWQTTSNTGRHDPFLLTPVVKYTPHRYGPAGAAFLENMQLRLAMPFALGTGEVPENGDLHFGWQQRWVKENGPVPTFSTLGEIRLPTRHHSSGSDGTFTAIAAKSLFAGTAYANAWIRTANGDSINDLRHLQWGFRGGYKLAFTDRVSLLAVYSHSSSEQIGRPNRNIFELAAAFRTRHHLAFGPGIFMGLDDHAETPNFGAGFRIVYLFNARDNPTGDQLESLRKDRGDAD